MQEPLDVVIIGGGVMGSAIAFNLLSIDPRISVVVVERDPSYRCASSALSVSSIRQQFSTPINIMLSRYSMGFFKAIGAHLSIDERAPDIALTERGYLYLATTAGKDALASNHALHRQWHVDVDLLDTSELAQRFPWLTTGDLASGSFGLSGEGWFDGYSVLQAFRSKARALGAKYLTGEAVRFDMNGRSVRRVMLGDGNAIRCGNVVNAAGPRARSVAQMAAIDLPVSPEKHNVFVFECNDPPPFFPLMIDPSGVYCRPDGRYFLAGPSREHSDRLDHSNLDVDHYLYEEVVWPTLAARVPAFESIRLVNAWAGYYEMNTFDQNALVGLAPDVDNLYLANGFSGHGMQHAPAVGLAVAELILHGHYRTLDLRSLSYDRIVRGEPMREINII